MEQTMHLQVGMDHFERLLVPVDFSADSIRAAERAVQLAPTGQIHLLHVTQPSAVMYPAAEIPIESTAMMYEPDESLRRMDDVELEKLEGRLREMAPEADLSREVLIGDPATDIIEKSQHFDLIVMGACRRGRLSRLLLGSVAQKTAREADCPVLIERERARETQPHA